MRPLACPCVADSSDCQPVCERCDSAVEASGGAGHPSFRTESPENPLDQLCHTSPKHTPMPHSVGGQIKRGMHSCTHASYFLGVEGFVAVGVELLEFHVSTSADLGPFLQGVHGTV